MSDGIKRSDLWVFRIEEDFIIRDPTPDELAAICSEWAAENGWTPPANTDEEGHGHPATMQWCDVCGDVSDELESVDPQKLGWLTDDL